MKTIWFCSEDKNEETLTSVAEIVGEELIKREQNVELIVQSEVKEILGKGLKDTPEDKSIFTDRLGFLGDLLHRNNVFALIVSTNATQEDRKKIKEEYGNYIGIETHGLPEAGPPLADNVSLLADIILDSKSDSTKNAKKVIDYLINQKLIPDETDGFNVYSEEEEQEIRKRLEDLGYV